MELHKKFRELRKEKGWSQEYVADQIFASPKTISSWECGHRKMDADAIEVLSKLYGYELQPEEKKEVTSSIVRIHDIMKSPNLSLSARDIIGQQKVTLRVDISQKLKRELRHLAETDESILDDIVEKGLAHYVLHLKQQDMLPKEDGLYYLESSYYEREMAFSKREARFLLEIYRKVIEGQGFEPEVKTIYELVEDRSKLDTVLYHVEEFGKEQENFVYVEHLFDEENSTGIKVIQKVNGWTIKEKPIEKEAVENRYFIFTPDGRCLENNLTLDEAIEWANHNHDFAQ